MDRPEVATQTLPQVSFDIRLGDKYSSVDFDYEAYKNLTYSQGGNYREFESAKIHLTADRGIFRGAYYPDGSITIADSSHKIVNSTLVHENQHHADTMTGIDNNEGLVKSNLSIQGSMGALALNLIFLGLKNIPEETVSDIGNAGYHTSGALLTISFLGVIRYYYQSDREKRARHAAKIHNNTNIISLTAK